MSLLKSIFNHEYRELKKFYAIAEKIDALDEETQKLLDYELKAKTDDFKERLKNGETLDDILVEAFAVVREAAFRAIGEKPYFVQIVGGITIHNGNIAEMKTGEGKTLSLTMPAYLNALSGEGVHVVTVNEYLAGFHAGWMGKIFNFLGLTVGVNTRDLNFEEKKAVYECDILYTTNNELGFDYLRDNMAVKSERRVQRKLNFAIVDEVDSILIDEARTPLIISGGFMKSLNLYKTSDSFAKTLRETDDYIKDDKTKAVSLTDLGSEKAEKYFKLNNLYDINNSGLVHHINQAIKANFGMKKDVDYVVDNDEIVIVDQFTGRLMKGRAYSEGLHQAIEAKESVTIKEETQTLATITFQNLFRMYKKLSGMTGTAKTEEEEFRNIYNMYVIPIPTNKPVIREDLADLVYATKKGKYAAIVRVIEEVHKAGQPVLVGTIAIETSELISDLLTKKKVPHEVLNAKNHAREAEIIANAGLKGAVTIATNMAGRGTDIKLGEGVRELGGLFVVGTERHESRRIDNQLRGRSGRQGDPGKSQFFVSLEDEIMVRFGSERVKKMMLSLGFDEQAIRSKVFSNAMETAQKRVEGYNFDIRKQLLQYDDVINRQREIIYEKRNKVLDEESIHDHILDSIKGYISQIVNSHLIEEMDLNQNDKVEIVEAVNENLLRKKTISVEDLNNLDSTEIIDKIYNTVIEDYENKIKDIPTEVVNAFEKAIHLNIVDRYWMEHINTMDHLREGIGLRGYAQENPLQSYISEGFNMFEEMMSRIEEQTSIYLIKAEIRQNIETKEVSNIATNEDQSKTAKKQPKKVKKIGRNEPCPCGSGKKYKQCCGK
ncbi:MAG: preprotein translocase subunit SecA [Bacilli bacterium]|nr:preprotein translocase subunit SecA [Bacilli bacterium]MDD3305158.1 preprotein translocase subunit SecA [Bacilli bacterium]MDD4053983.1 preprotein translocase subunit SecA [Bacilli bacterium]MDD4411736.1 preprotein translocase subunit SecA [Bacilli bacterium]